MTIREPGPQPAHGRRRGPLVARLLAVAGLLLGASAGAVTGAAPAAAAACTSSTGVTVVVDFGSLGGTSVSCVSRAGSGLDTLQGAGHSVTYVPRQPGLVCTIDRQPDPCNGAPVTAYWSYWRASPGGSWSYSTVGAASTHPKSGTVEGWAFGAGKPPAVRPPAVSRPKTTSTSRPSSRTTTSRPTSTAGTDAGGGASRTTGPAAPASTSAATSPTTATASTVAGTSTSPGTGTSDVPTATRTDAAAPTSATSPSSGTGSLVVAVLLVLLLAGGGGVIAWRRRGSGA